MLKPFMRDFPSILGSISCMYE